MSQNLALDNHNLIPDFGTVFSNLVPANTITGVMVGCLLENITAARNKFTTANNEWYTAIKIHVTVFCHYQTVHYLPVKLHVNKAHFYRPTGLFWRNVL